MSDILWYDIWDKIFKYSWMDQVIYLVHSWILDVRRYSDRTSYEITLVHLSVCPSLSFRKIGSLVFSDIVHDDSWPWHIVTDRPRFLKENFGSLNLGQMGKNQAQKLGFLPSFQVWFISVPWNCTKW